MSLEGTKTKPVKFTNRSSQLNSIQQTKPHFSIFLLYFFLRFSVFLFSYVQGEFSFGKDSFNRSSQNKTTDCNLSAGQLFY